MVRRAQRVPRPRRRQAPAWEEACEGKEGDEAIRAVFDKWLNTPWGEHPWEKDGWPFWSLFYNVKTWWDAKDLPNVLMVHFTDLKKDLAGQMRRIAEFIGTSPSTTPSLHLRFTLAPSRP